MAQSLFKKMRRIKLKGKEEDNQKKPDQKYCQIFLLLRQEASLDHSQLRMVPDIVSKVISFTKSQSNAETV